MLNFLNSFLGFYQRHKGRIFKIFIIVLVLSVFLFSEYGLVKRVDLILTKKNITGKISKQNTLRDSLKRRMDVLQHDSLEIEKIARVHYGMTKPGEKIFIITDK
jgi:cell division protein FtsB